VTNTPQRIVIYTVVTGDYDTVVDPLFLSPRCSHICLTDGQKFASEKWTVKPLPQQNLGRERLSRHPKVLPHRYFPDFDVSIYIDANMTITGDLADLASSVLDSKHDLALFHHPLRNCVYDEAKACLKDGRERFSVLHRQMDHYRAVGYPARNGLVAGGIVIRRHNNPEVVRLMEAWWEDIVRFSHRDQLSFNFAVWKHKLPYAIIEEDIFSNPYVSLRPHRSTGIRKCWQWLNRYGKGNFVLTVPLFAGNLILKGARALLGQHRDP